MLLIKSAVFWREDGDRNHPLGPGQMSKTIWAMNGRLAGYPWRPTRSVPLSQAN